MTSRMASVRSLAAHGALEHVWNAMMSINGGWVVEADIKSLTDE